MHDIEKELSNHKCKTCGNLDYWDWYFCRLDKHQTKEGFLKEKPLIECNKFVKRKGDNWNSCKEQECIFWCEKCPAYKNKNN